MLYSEAFRKMGVPNVVRGSPCAALNNDGILCVMRHAHYFKRGPDGYYYEHPAQPGLSALPSASKALTIIDGYYAADKSVIIAVGLFHTNGGPDGTGKVHRRELQGSDWRCVRSDA
ncbi:hypothetical protein [Methylibium sp.]|uniref:hypothetical protein n=1 Tax=Methylibium sp. TaxID=2067992 RepID=UPI003BABE4CB